jgi:hypothetical protein
VKRFLSDGQSTSDDAMAILDELAKSASNEQSREALAGLLGVMLEVDDQNVAARAVVHLGRLAGNAGPDWLWRLCARVRSGVRIEALSRLSERMDPAESGAALRWLFEITHMTTQERQRFVGVSDSKERLAELNTIDVRRGQLVDGKYGVLAVMETSVAAAGFEGQCMWTPPVRSTVVLPPLSLDLDIDQDRYAVRFGDTVLGHGLGVAQDHTPKATAYYYGLVESLDGGPFAVKATTQPMDGPGTGSIARYGPLVLPSMRASQTPARGEMTLDLAGYLNAALPSVGAASPPIEPADVPITLPITLRYFRFGGYVGAAERRPFPKKTKPGDRHFLNIMLILERIEEDGVQ